MIVVASRYILTWFFRFLFDFSILKLHVVFYRIIYIMSYTKFNQTDIGGVVLSSVEELTPCLVAIKYRYALCL